MVSEESSVLSNFLGNLVNALGLAAAESVSGIPKNLFPLENVGVLSSFIFSASVSNGTIAALTSSLTGTKKSIH
jgi:hypothetical protein